MISIIIPVYNVGPYLRHCLDSVVDQTYRDLEIIIIDDGSNDGCSNVCDEYKKDHRVKVFHTENRGLSCARNLGIEKAKGEYISFVDSDDWIEITSMQKLLEYAADTNADIVSSAYYFEWKNHHSIGEEIEKPIILEGENIIQTHIRESYLGSAIWNKLYRKTVFSNIRFPEGRVFEDIMTSYKLLSNAKRVVCIPDALYHYRLRSNTISRTYTMASMTSYWYAHRERFNTLSKTNPECLEALVKDCLEAIGRMCRWYISYTDSEKESAETTMIEMQEFSKKYYKVIMRSGYYSNYMKVSCICAKTRSKVLFAILYSFLRVYMIGKRRKLYLL